MTKINYTEEKLTALRKQMRKLGLDGLLVTDNTDQLYLTDFFFYKEETVLLIGLQKVVAVTRQLYQQPFSKFAPYMQVIGQDSNRSQAILAQIRKLGLKKVGFDAAKETYVTGQLFRKNGLVEVPSLLASLRETKNPQELKALRAANRLAYLTYEYIKPRVKTGMTECEVAAEMERFMRIHGAKCTSFFTIVAFGENTANPHHETGARKLRQNEAVLMDFGCVYDNYCSDMTRSWWHGNNPAPEYTKIWKITDTARKQGIKAARIGTSCQKVDATCRDFITKAGYGPYFTHGTGHGVGLEIHEEPYNNQTSAAILRAGNIVTVEPGIYLPGKYGVRLEDTVVITPTGAKILTRK